MDKVSDIKNNLFENVWLAFVVALLCIIGVFFLKPLSIIIHNPFDFSATFNDSLFHYFSSAALYWVGLSIILLLFVNSKYKSQVIALFFSVGLLFWVQGTLLDWDYGLLDGHDVDWNSFFYREIIDITLWVGVLYLAQKYRLVLLKNVVMLSLAIIFVQVLTVSLAYLESPLANIESAQSENKKNYKIDYEKEFVFSKDKNVIVLVLDAYGEFVFEAILKTYPGVINYFDGFTRYTNVLGSGGHTAYSVPSYFTGVPYLNKIPHNEYLKQVFSSDDSLLKNLRKEGWHVGFYKKNFLNNVLLRPDLLTEIKATNGKNFSQSDYNLVKIGFYTSVPQPIKRVVYQVFDLGDFWIQAKKRHPRKNITYKRVTQFSPFVGDSADLEFINAMLTDAAVEYDRPAFKYYHLNGVHTPHTIDRNFKKTKSSIFEEGMASLTIAVRFINILKELNIYKSSQIYIMADHSSYPSSSDEETVRELIAHTYPNQAAPLFLFKDFNSTGSVKTDSTPLTYFDFPRIVMGLMKKDVDVSSAIQHFSKEKRYFYSFSFTAASEYYPRIIEMEVVGPVANPASWSMTGNSYMPAIIEDKVRKLTWNDGFSLESQEAFFHYVSDGLLSSGTYSRGHSVEFRLPIDKDLIENDIVVTLTLAPVLGEDVTSRKIQITTHEYKSNIIQLDVDQYQDYSFLFPAGAITNGQIKFSLALTKSDAVFVASDGARLYGPGLKLKKLFITKDMPGEQRDLIKLTLISMNSETKAISPR